MMDAKNTNSNTENTENTGKSADLRAALEYLLSCQTRPAPYAPGDSDIWMDDHLSKGMLAAHLDDSTDAASFRPETREALLRLIDDRFPAERYPRALDLGCGPGLYVHELARRGRDMTGIDQSARSLAYARECAARDGLPIRYIEGNYCRARLLPEGARLFDLAYMISYDFGVLSPENRAALLRSVRAALRAGGALLLDVLTTDRPMPAEGRSWYCGSGGYWSEGDYAILNHCRHYGDHVSCLQTLLWDERGIRGFHIWEHLFTREELSNELARAGFAVREVLGDHAGRVYAPGDASLMVVAEAV